MEVIGAMVEAVHRAGQRAVRFLGDVESHSELNSTDVDRSLPLAGQVDILRAASGMSANQTDK